MENASKALIIAGAILLAILLISLGIMIFSQAQDTVNNSGMSQAEISAFNSQFIKYEREKVKGSEIKSLINEAISSNSDANHQSSAALVAVSITNGSTSEDLITVSGNTTTTKAGATSKAVANTLYKVSLDYKNGRVSKITITENKNT